MNRLNAQQLEDFLACIGFEHWPPLTQPQIEHIARLLSPYAKAA